MWKKKKWFISLKYCTTSLSTVPSDLEWEGLKPDIIWGNGRDHHSSITLSLHHLEKTEDASRYFSGPGVISEEGGRSGDQLLSVALSSANPRDFQLEIRATANAAWHRINSPRASSLLLQSCHWKKNWVGLCAPHRVALRGRLERQKRSVKWESLKRSILQPHRIQAEGESIF